MKQRRGLLALGVAVVLAWSVGLTAQNKDDKKKTDAQNKEIQSIIKTVDDVAAGQPGSNDFDLKWAHEDVLKAQGKKEYVPFTVSIDPAKVPGGRIALYWRVVSKSATPEAAPAGGQKDDKKEKDKKKPDYAYEDMSFIPSTTTAMTSPSMTSESKTQTQGNTATTSTTTTFNPSQPVSMTSGLGPRISRSFTVSAGTYDVYVVAKEPLPEKPQKNAPPPKMSVIKQTVTVPDFWNDEFNTSTVILALRIDPLPAPLTPQQQADRPYALGMMEIVPVADAKFTKKSELSTFMLIYNPKVDKDNKPDVTVEYNFCQVAAGGEPKAGEPCKSGEKFFNKTNPQNLNASTLPPQFDMAAGHQLQSGQAVSLAPFPEGQYRLEIKVTDKVANKSLIRDVTFTVSAS